MGKNKLFYLYLFYLLIFIYFYYVIKLKVPLNQITLGQGTYDNNKQRNALTDYKIDEMWIESKNEMKVLGMVFDSRLDWYKQVDVSILKVRRTSQALEVVGKYFTEKERGNLVTSLV